MDPEQQRRIAREGGKAAHRLGVAHEFNSEEARQAGRKGGESEEAGCADRPPGAPGKLAELPLRPDRQAREESKSSI